MQDKLIKNISHVPEKKYNVAHKGKKNRLFKKINKNKSILL